MKNIFYRWGALHDRDALLDQISTLRMVFSVSANDQDVEHVCGVLFMRQRAGIRKTLAASRSKNEPRQPATVAKAILLMRYIFAYLKSSFPKLADVVEEFEGETFWRTFYGLDQHGMKVEDGMGEEELARLEDDDSLEAGECTYGLKH